MVRNSWEKWCGEDISVPYTLSHVFRVGRSVGLLRAAWTRPTHTLRGAFPAAPWPQAFLLQTFPPRNSLAPRQFCHKKDKTTNSQVVVVVVHSFSFFHRQNNQLPPIGLLASPACDFGFSVDKPFRFLPVFDNGPISAPGSHGLHSHPDTWQPSRTALPPGGALPEHLVPQWETHHVGRRRSGQGPALREQS